MKHNLTFSPGRMPEHRIQNWAILLLTAYVLFQPLLDVLTSLGTQAGMSLTLGTVVRPLFMLAAFLYVVLSRPFPGKKPVMVYLGLITGYLATFTLWNLYYGGLAFAVQNLMSSMKPFFVFFASALLYTLFKQCAFVVPDRVLAAACGGYCIVILLAFLTGTSFASYNAGYGFCGWFYSANDISALIMLTSPVALCLCLESLGRHPGIKKLGLICILLISLIFSAAFIGTKLVFLGVAIFLAVSLIWFGVRLIFLHKKQTAAFLTVAILLALLLGLYQVSPLNHYIKDIYIPMSGTDQTAMEESLKIPGLVEKDRAEANRRYEEAAEGTWLGDLIKTNPLVGKLNLVLSRRLLMIAPIAHEYGKSPSMVKLLGLGYCQHPNYEKDISRLVEMEGLAFLLRHGAVGLVLCYLPFLAVTAWLAIQFLRRLKSSMSSYLRCSLMYSVLMACAVSLVVGHVVQTPSVSLLTMIIYQKLILSFHGVSCSSSQDLAAFLKKQKGTHTNE